MVLRRFHRSHGGAAPEPGRSDILIGALWMVGITIGLFFLPAINGLIGGIVGGYRAGSVKRALIAAILPALVVALVVWFAFAVLDLALWGMLAGLTLGLVIALADLGMFVGAVIGGAWRQRASPRARH